jgi:hypothetical protein
VTSVTDKRILAALGGQAGAFAVVLLLGGFTRVGAAPAVAPSPTPTVTITTTVTPAPSISTKYVQVSPTHHHRSSAPRTVGPQPAPDVAPTYPPARAASSPGHP